MSDRYQIGVEFVERHPFYEVIDTAFDRRVRSCGIGEDGKALAVETARRLNDKERLRDAAEDLLEALNKILATPRDDTSPETYYSTTQDIARAAIAKAEK